MSTKADRLRGRLSINPDAPLPVPESVAAAPTQAAPQQEEPELTPDTPAPPAEPEPPAEARQTASAPAKRSRAAKTKVPAPVSAIDDPTIRPGRKDYRSFYLEDEIFARFRAAVYWLSRHPEASAEVGENMSVAVERWMADTANDLERRYNHGEVFRMPPGSRRRKSAK